MENFIHSISDDFHTLLFPVLHDYAESERYILKKGGYLPVPILPDLFYYCCSEMKCANEVNKQLLSEWKCKHPFDRKFGESNLIVDSIYSFTTNL